jgi:hypothetical protein
MSFRSVLVDIITIVLLFGAYFLFAGEVSPNEWIACTIAVSASVSFIVVRRRSSSGRWGLAAPAYTVLHPLAALWPDTVEVLRALALAIWCGRSGDHGAFVRQQPPRDERLGSKGIRMLGQSLTPKNFVLGEADRSEILHHLAPVTPQGDAA